MDELINNIYKIIKPRIDEIDKNNKLGKSGLELEIRFGYLQDDKFDTDITKKNWDIILKKLNKSAKNSIFEKEIIKQKDEYYDTYRKTYIYSDSINKSNKKEIFAIVKKDKLVNLNIETNSIFDIRISLSNEVELEKYEKEELKFSRLKHRYTFIYKNWNYDLSIIELINNNIKKNYYELELELNDNNILKDENLLKIFLKSSITKIIDIFKIFDNDQSNYNFKII